MGIEKISPLAWLRRRRQEKIDRELRIVELGRICPRCLIPVKVEVGDGCVVFRCSECRSGWGLARPSQNTGRKSVNPRPKAECGAEPGEPELMYR